MTGRRGSVLVVVLFVLLVLSATGLSLAYRVALEMRSVQRRSILARLRHGAESAVVVAVARLAENQNEFDHPAEPWRRHVPLWQDGWLTGFGPRPDGSTEEFTVDYQVIDEESKVNVLWASSEALERLGMTPEQVAALLDWMDADDFVRTGGAEDGYYLAQAAPHRCKNAPLELLDELLLIKGFDSAGWLGEDDNGDRRLDPSEDDGDLTEPSDNADGQLKLGWAGLLTCLGAGRINLNTAPEEVLATLPLSDGAVGQVTGFRQFDERSSGSLEDHAFRSAADIDQLQGLTDADREVLRQVAAYRSEHFRIFAEARHVPTGLRYRLEVVVRQNGADVEVLQWRSGA